MTRERGFSLAGAAALLVTLPLAAGAQTTTDAPKVFFACYGSLTGVVYRIKEPGLPTSCLHRTHVQFSWTSGTGGAALTDHGALQGLGNDDHPQYLLVDGSRALTGALSVGGHKLTNLAAATANGEAVRFEDAVKSGDAAGGDLSGTYPLPTVAKLQNTAVSAAAPANGQVLAFDGQAWKPTPPASGGGNGISGWELVNVRNDFISTNPNQPTDIEAKCPAGKLAMGGGYTKATVVAIGWNRPMLDGTGWHISVVNTVPGAGASANAIAVCVNAAP